MSEETRRYFTIEEANRTLPLVRRIVSDIVEEYRGWQERVHRYELMAATNTDLEETDEQVQIRSEIDEAARRINDCIAELDPIGCLFKGFDTGLVDFYSRYEDRDIFLCWRLGEDYVGHWHETDAGFRGRQELTPEMAIEED